MTNIEITNVETSVGKVKLITLKTKKLEVVLSSYGAGIFKLIYDGKSIATTPEKLEDYLTSKAYYGKTIGRHSGRLFGPNYDIDGDVFDVQADENEISQLHGGKTSLAFQHFTLTGYERMGDATSVTFQCITTNDGFPGKLKLDVTYEVTKDDALMISYHGSSTAPTICNITNHIYLNVGHPESILDQSLYLDSDYYLDIETSYRLKSIKQTVNTPYDFRLPKRLASSIYLVKQPDIAGYDNCFLLNKHDDQEAIFRLANEISNLTVDVFTDYPSVVVYTHNHPALVKLENVSTNGVHSSVTAECQYPPDGIHNEHLDSGILRPREVFKKFIKIKPYYKK